MGIKGPSLGGISWSHLGLTREGCRKKKEQRTAVGLEEGYHQFGRRVAAGVTWKSMMEWGVSFIKENKSIKKNFKADFEFEQKEALYSHSLLICSCWKPSHDYFHHFAYWYNDSDNLLVLYKSCVINPVSCKMFFGCCAPPWHHRGMVAPPEAKVGHFTPERSSWLKWGTEKSIGHQSLLYF